MIRKDLDDCWRTQDIVCNCVIDKLHIQDHEVP